MPPILIALLPFIGALLPGLLVRSGRSAAAISCGTTTLAALIGLWLDAPEIIAGRPVVSQLNWVPMLGLSADFRVDGLGLLFGTLILGIGLLIIIYARFYLSRKDPAGQFYTYLMLFQGAMMGIVLSDNILLLLIFWEITSLSSFLLIGFWKHLPEGRQGARMALTVTGFGGLAMIAGALILGQISGTYSISEMLTQRAAIQASPLYLPALLLILLGAFTKSAQFPFHFWLPHAMAAPTPVSAYLHSATMVKAGIFLMARLWPVLSGTAEWFWIVSVTGLITMVLGAYIALFKDDLKAILAYSTVSHLGLITMLLGFSTPIAVVTAVFHIINHATFKASLFMGAGIIDHEVGTRDIRRLGGLRRLMPLTCVLMVLAGLSMAGIPPLNGFLSKEMMLEDAAHEPAWAFPVFATLGAMISVGYSLRLIFFTFWGPERDDYPQKPHDPGFWLWISPAVLVVLVVAIGLMPRTIAGPLVSVSARDVMGMAAALPEYHLRLWNGFTPALWMSIIAVAGGVAIVLMYRPLRALWAALPHPDAKTMFDALWWGAMRAARRITDRLHDGSMPNALAALVLTVMGTAALAWFTGQVGPQTRPMLPADPISVIAWIMLMMGTVCMLLFHRNRLLALVLVGIVGLIVSVSFAYLSAPDLALTQVSVEVVTVVLLLLALNFLPKSTLLETRDSLRGFQAFVAGLAGLGFGGLAYAIMRRDSSFESIANYHLANSYTGGGGHNVVNVILVDFRGYDTFGEITVLGIAALAIFALTETLLVGTSSRRLRGWVYDQPRAGDRHPLLLVVATRLILPISLVVGLFIFLRGHNEPGGGFVAGLVVSVSLVMQYMASGFAWTQDRQRVPYHVLIGLGVVAAGITGIGAWFFDLPFLTSTYGYFRIPPLEKFELATAMGFDLGVFLCVVGAVMLALNSLSRIARRAGQSVNIDPMDIYHKGPTESVREAGQ
ncbi:monovalent cation/H+ antiporter subunit A [Paracoccus pacificus]|uniref:Monovalent cation/H+ antiporter subunit A n=1 Tax=Paracoccus pacificus TaxID=1463598 RepID=A0ABW4RAD8_9RHOB